MQYISYLSLCYKIPDSNLREDKFILARELRIRHGGERCGVHGGGSVGLFTFPPVLLLSGQGGGCWHFPGFFFSPFSSVQGPIPWNGAVRINVGLPSWLSLWNWPHRHMQRCPVKVTVTAGLTRVSS